MPVLVCRDRHIEFPRRPLVMGILNLNDDSFSGDGTLDIDKALKTAGQMIADGADIIDVGGESARTNRAAIEEQAEIARVQPFIERFPAVALKSIPTDAAQVFPPLLSINTWRPNVARTLLSAGGDILNDMSGLQSSLENAQIAAEYGVALLVMHSVGKPKIAHTHVRHEDILKTLLAFFQEKTTAALAAGVRRDSIILDPGIDFAKQRDDNLRIYREFRRIAALGFPTLLPVSRKTVIGDVLDVPQPPERDPGTVACIVSGALAGANIFRVHNVRAAWQTLKMLEAIRPL
ncbi:MAG TPA: dihydropteroate synthase [Chthoniobacterales bacterium]